MRARVCLCSQMSESVDNWIKGKEIDPNTGLEIEKPPEVWVRTDFQIRR